ncbi:MAG: hypothetical protein Q7T91_04555 [Sulfuricurvum sp.]|nr:hypothetical protein [Sulfuricurvum sp.]
MKPIPSLSPREELQRGEIVSAPKIFLLISHILYNQKILIDMVMDRGEKNLQFYTSMKMVKYLFKVGEEGYMMRKEFYQIKKDLKIRFDK